MPTYEYACRDCGHHIEVVRRFADEPLSVCPSCGGQLRKVFHPAGILLKGSGFYKTDNRPKKTASESTSSSDSSSSSGSESSSSKSSAPSKGKEKPAPSKGKEKSA